MDIEAGVRHPQEKYFQECVEGMDGWSVTVYADSYVEVTGREGLVYNSAVEFDADLIEDHARDEEGEIDPEIEESVRLDATTADGIFHCIQLKMDRLREEQNSR